MRRFCILIAFAIVCILANAQQITEQQALEKAQAFLKGKQFRSSAKTRSLNRARSKTVDKESMYIFNVENKGGFVIVSGDERTEPILGYSTSGEIDYDNMPDNLRTWLEGYEAQIKAINENPKLAVRKTESGKAAIAPMIQTKWGQGNPYCSLCPEDDNARCLTGCVATAVAQVMYYHKWPQTSKAIPGYTTQTKEIVVEDLPEYTFEWDKMKYTYSYDDTGDAVNAVAKLMRYCGQAMGTDYTSDEGSEANVYEYSLIHYFGYSENISEVSRSRYLNSEWNNLLYDELANKRPVLYSGFSAANIENISGHQFILDGYDDGLFHVNWGWSGSCDGFFLLSIMNPVAPGGDNALGASMYVVNQTAVLGMEPSGSVVDNLPEISAEIVGYANETRYRESSDQDYGSVYLSGSVSYRFIEKPDAPLTIELGWGVYKRNGEFVSCLGYVPLSLEEASGSISNNLDAWFGKEIPEGSFYAYQIYRVEGETEWHLCPNSPSAILVDNYSNCLNIYSESANNPSFYIRDFEVLGLPEPNVPLNIRLKLYTEMLTKTQTIYLWEGYNGNWEKIGMYQAYMNQDEEYNVYVTYLPSSDKLGEVTLRFTYTENVNYAPRDFTLQIAPLKSISVNGFNYVYNEETKVAKLVSYSVPDKKHVSIPTYFDISEMEGCSVEYIEEGAFEGYGMTSVELPPFIKYIGKNAFRSCPLQKVSLPWGLIGIGENAFADNDKLLTVISRTTHPFGIADNVFDYSANTTVYVAEGEKSLYESLSGWKKFRNIVEIDDFENVVTYQIEINDKNFPDEKFRNYLLTDGLMQHEAPGSDGILTDKEIESIRLLELEGKNIQSLKGIELLPRLNNIRCDGNLITSLDVSSLQDLEYLSCSNNQLTSLDLSNNKELKLLQCQRNQLISLNVSNCENLVSLDFSENKLASIDLSSCIKLRELSCQNNLLTELNVSLFPELNSLSCDFNDIASLNVSGTAMKYLVCNNNKLKSLDISNLTELIYCYCYNNELELLKANGCTSVTSLHFYSNKLKGKVIDELFESLPKVQPSSDLYGAPMQFYDLYVIDPSDPNEGNAITPAQVEAATNKGWRICERSNGLYPGSDPTKYIYINEENFPDEDFRNILLAEWFGEDGVITDLELPIISTITINGYVEDLKGIENFTELESLRCNDNIITSLDLSKNTKLKELFFEKNLLKTIDLSENKELEEVILQHNKLTSIVLPENAKIKRLDLEDNKLTSLDVTGCPLLEELICFNNKLTELKVANCEMLGRLLCDNNKLTELDLTGCTSLSNLICANNLLTSLDLTKLIKLTYLGCDGNQLTTLDITKLKKLQSLTCCDNNLTSLDLSNNISLNFLKCTTNKLSALNFSGCPKIDNIWMYGNNISGEAMDALIESLPDVNNKYLPIIDLSPNSGDRNVVTEAQVAALAEKGWLTYSYNNGMLLPYEGGEDILIDVNGDNVLDAKDITDLIAFIAGKSPNSVTSASADVNSDGVVNIADIVMISNMVARE